MRSEDYADGNDDQEGVWSEPDDPDVHAKTRDSGSSSEYCFDTPIPLLARDPFETVSEFDERINHHPPFVVGHGLLIKAEYDIETGRFPMEIRWGDPMVPIPGLPKTGDYSYIAAPRDQARAMYQLLSDPVEYPIFAHLSAADGAVSARKAVLSTKEGDFPIQWEGPLPGRRISLLPGFEFVFIPPGEFWMGGSEEEPERYGDESPRRRVRLTEGFFMQTTPVTVKQWNLYIRTNWLIHEHTVKQVRDAPAAWVSWENIQGYLEKVNEEQPAVRFRLPTETEWEYACRAGAETAFWNGPIARPVGYDSGLDRIGWYAANARGRARPVAGKKPNPWGLHDMHGNVWEWCSDWYAKDSYSRGPEEDPKGPEDGEYRVVRGGAYNSHPKNCRAAYRAGRRPGFQAANLGFRLVAER